MAIEAGSASATRAQPVLTICTPTYERPELLRRALGSVIAQVDPRMATVELSSRTTR